MVFFKSFLKFFVSQIVNPFKLQIKIFMIMAFLFFCCKIFEDINIIDISRANILTYSFEALDIICLTSGVYLNIS